MLTELGASPATRIDDAGESRPQIVGIGASAGGIEAFREFFGNMPADSGLGFVVILHLPPDRKSLLPEILSRWTSMRVTEVTPGCLVEANCVYVPPAGSILTLRDGHLYPHRPGVDEPREITPIDLFFDSLATALNEDATGVILSGTGSDGALGLKAIKLRGGLTLAQGVDGTFPLHSGMPAIATGAVDIVVSVEAMPALIISVQEARRDRNGPVEASGAETDAARLAICAALQQQVGHDFRGYKDKTFLRRVNRRMQVTGLVTLAGYVTRLEGDRAEAVMLFRDLLIGVTSFFRDAATFDLLQLSVLPGLFAGKRADDTVRVWVPGCATGEEAYSLAMLLCEYADSLGGTAPRIQVFATDIDEPAIVTARVGRYPSTLLQGMSPGRLSRFFIAGDDGSYTVTKEVRKLCSFSAHSLTRDPPFSRIDLVSCRNLLIYLDMELQAIVLPAFHYSLVPDGILLLGSSETVSRHEDLFATLDRNHRIFQRRNVPSPPLRLSGKPNRQAPARGKTALGAAGSRGGTAKTMGRVAARILDRFAPAFVVVAANGEVVQFSSRVGRYLEPAAGSPTQNVLALARHGLRTHLRAALKQAVETGRPVERASIPVAGEGIRHVTLAIEPLPEYGSNTLYLVVFVEPGQLAGDAKPELAEDAGLEGGLDRQLKPSCATRGNSSRASPRSTKSRSRSCGAPTRSCTRSTRNCSPPTKNWRHPRRKSSPSTRSWRRSTASSPARWTSWTTGTAISRTCSRARKSRPSSWTRISWSAASPPPWPASTT